jgi:hypothetical protein
MRAHLFIVCVTVFVGCLTPSCFATPTNTVASVKTNYVSNGILTADELDTVVKLANSCGIIQVAEVSTFHRLPSLDPSIEVIGADYINGRKVTYETLEVFKEGWAWRTKPTGTLSAVSIGQFWVEGIPEHHELTIFNTGKGPIRVNVDGKIPIDVADRIVKAITVGTIHYSKTFDLARQSFEIEDRSQPNWIKVRVEDQSGHYWIGFGGSLNEYQLELNGEDVTMLSVTFVTP